MKSTILKESRMTQILWLPLIKKRDALKEKEKEKKRKENGKSWILNGVVVGTVYWWSLICYITFSLKKLYEA